MNRGAWKATGHRVAESGTITLSLSYTSIHIENYEFLPIIPI